MREVTEREEGIKAGTAVLVGTSKKKILAAAIKLLDNPKAYSKMSRAVNPYGKGDSALKITAILLKESK
jgi:UDP-N-acetylglucosamine 2-epimerase (non-hydrolysing)